MSFSRRSTDRQPIRSFSSTRMMPSGCPPTPRPRGGGMIVMIGPLEGPPADSHPFPGLYTLSLSLSLSHSHSLTHSFTHSLYTTHTHIHTLSLSLSHILTHSHTHTHTHYLSLSHILTPSHTHTHTHTGAPIPPLVTGAATVVVVVALVTVATLDLRADTTTDLCTLRTAHQACTADPLLPRPLAGGTLVMAPQVPRTVEVVGPPTAMAPRHPLVVITDVINHVLNFELFPFLMNCNNFYARASSLRACACLIACVYSTCLGRRRVADEWLAAGGG